MSQLIVNDHPWSDSEVEYQLSRGRKALVERNRIEFPPGTETIASEEDSPTLALHPDIFTYVKDLTVEQLQEELKSADLSYTGDEKELKVRLAQHLQDQKDAEEVK